MWMVLSDGRTFLPKDSEITMVVSSGYTEHFVDDGLIPELKEKMLIYAVLKTPKNNTSSGQTDPAGHRHWHFVWRHH